MTTRGRNYVRYWVNSELWGSLLIWVVIVCGLGGLSIAASVRCLMDGVWYVVPIILAVIVFEITLLWWMDREGGRIFHQRKLMRRAIKSFGQL